MRERDEQIQRRGRELIELVARRLPQEFEIAGEIAAAWPAVGVALLSRMATTLGSILDLQHTRREADPATLTRSLYEHAVHFSWLAADPTATRLEEWRRQDLGQRLKTDKDAAQHGVELLSPARRQEYEKQRATMRGRDLKLIELAAEADDSWQGKLPGMGQQTDTISFRGMYATLYRHYSGTAHPSVIGLDRVVEDLSPTRRRIVLEHPSDRAGPFGVATIVFGIALFAAGSSIGWPQASEVAAIFDRYPGE